MSPKTEVRPTLYSEWNELEARADAAEAKIAEIRRAVESPRMFRAEQKLRAVEEILAERKDESSDFRRIDTENTSTLVCPCGARFNWSGVSDRLDPWREHHRPHLTESKEASDV